MTATRLNSLQLGTVGADSVGLLLGKGTNALPESTDVADTHFIDFRLENEATEGDNRGLYLRFYLSGAGGGGEAARIFATVNDVVAGTAHGAHISLNFATSGRVSGLGVAMRATLHIPSGGLSAGTYAAVQAEAYADGTGLATPETFALFRGVIDGNNTGKASVKTFLDLASVPAAGDGAFINTNAGALSASAYASLKVLTPAGVKYLRLYDAS
jgi:hypothetical protein